MTRREPQVSVVIPVFNGARYVAEAVESALMQEGVDLEVIVIDDGSTDDSDKVIRKFGASVIYIRQDNRGVACARNVGIRHARGCYVALLDQDDRFLRRKLEMQVRFMDGHSSAVLCHGNLLLIDEDGNPAAADYIGFEGKSPPPSGVVLMPLYRGNFVHACTALFRRDVAKSLGLFREDLSLTDDYLLWMRCATKGHVCYLPEYLAEYRLHAQNASKNEFKMSEGRLLARLYLLEEVRELLDSRSAREMRRILTERACQDAYRYYKSGRGVEARRLLAIARHGGERSVLLWKMWLASFLHA